MQSSAKCQLTFPHVLLIHEGSWTHLSLPSLPSMDYYVLCRVIYCQGENPRKLPLHKKNLLLGLKPVNNSPAPGDTFFFFFPTLSIFLSDLFDHTQYILSQSFCCHLQLWGSFNLPVNVLVNQSHSFPFFLNSTFECLMEFVSSSSFFFFFFEGVEKAMAPHSSTLAWKIPWTEEPGRLQSMGSQRVGHD